MGGSDQCRGVHSHSPSPVQAFSSHVALSRYDSFFLRVHASFIRQKFAITFADSPRAKDLIIRNSAASIALTDNCDASVAVPITFSRTHSETTVDSTRLYDCRGVTIDPHKANLC